MGRGEIWKREWRALLDLLLPPLCLLCKESRPGWPGGFCRACLRRFPSLPDGFCPRCSLPYEGGAGIPHLCGDCLKQPPVFEKVIALGLYAGVLREAVHQLKYSTNPLLDRPLGALLAGRLRHRIPATKRQLIVPVPLHKTRLRERSFNQSALLGKEVARRLDMGFSVDLLERCRATLVQQGLGAEERRRNLKGAFRLAGSLAGETVVLVDDVMTTGATVDECARVLVRGGAGQVVVAVLARAGRYRPA